MHAHVFADWLEMEGGYPAHAELIRLHHNKSTAVETLVPGGYRGWQAPGPNDGSQISTVVPWVSMPGRDYPSNQDDHYIGRSPTHTVLMLHLPTGPHTTQFAAKIPNKAAEHLKNALVEEGAQLPKTNWPYE